MGQCQAEITLQHLGRLAPHRPPVEEGRARETQLAAEEKGLADREGGNEKAVLVDEVNAEFFRKMRRQPVIGPAVDLKPALIRPVKAGDELDQRRLACAVLPDETVDRTTHDGQRRTRQGRRPAKVLDDVFETDDRLAIPCRTNHDRNPH